MSKELIFCLSPVFATSVSSNGDRAKLTFLCGVSAQFSSTSTVRSQDENQNLRGECRYKSIAVISRPPSPRSLLLHLVSPPRVRVVSLERIALGPPSAIAAKRISRHTGDRRRDRRQETGQAPGNTASAEKRPLSHWQASLVRRREVERKKTTRRWKE